MNSSLRKNVGLLASLMALPIALITFASGFFPYKPMLPGLATRFDQVPPDYPEPPAAPFDRVIFMVIDALRSDFVYGHNTGFTYTQDLINNGAAIPFTAHATPPTVTMPRIKALTTGSVPSFLDLILNFAESDTSSSLASQDTWLAQLRLQPHGRLVFYGDDTWLKLFPDADFFARHDGTSSFFVSDFTEVDNNVTRHLPAELSRHDWNGMIMHYLGLDHIGHKTGPDGPNMLSKQEEMDGIVKLIYETMQNERHHNKTLLVVAGDHGMNAVGNHGGSGPGETEPALIFVSPLFSQTPHFKSYPCPTSPRPGTEFHFYKKVEQSDMVPTLSVLLGLPIPKNNLGVILQDVLDLWPVEAQHALLRQNIAQIQTIVESVYGKDEFRAEMSAFGNLSTADASQCSDTGEDWQMLACKFAIVHNAATSTDSEIWKSAHYDWLHSAQELLSSTASSYNLSSMSYGLLIAIIGLVFAIFAIPSPLALGFDAAFLGLAGVLYGIMMFASSYVEEEQHFWYWLTPVWFAFLACRSVQINEKGRARFWSRIRPGLASLSIIAVHRLSIRWNQTGQKHAGAPDLVHTVFPKHHQLMWLVILGTYVLIGYQIFSDALGGLLADELAAPTALLTVLAGVVFKLNFTQADAPELVQGLATQLRALTAPFSLVAQARLVFALLALLAAMVSILGVRQSTMTTTGRYTTERVSTSTTLAYRLQPLLAFFLATQTRAPNVPLLLLMDVQARLLQIVLSSTSFLATQQMEPIARRRTLETAVSVLLLSYTSFFCFGGSNSISSLDLSNAYNGVADYNIVAVGILLFASNWTGPIWWTMASFSILAPARKPTPAAVGQTRNTQRSWVQEEHHKLHIEAIAATDTKNKQPLRQRNAGWRDFVAVLTIFHAVACIVIMAACTALRTHLFVWTVFSPKYLYAMAWTVGWHILINCGLGGLMRLLAAINVDERSKGYT